MPQRRPRQRPGPSPLRYAAAIGALVLCTAWSARQASGWSPVIPLVPAGVETVASALPASPELTPAATMGRIGAPAAHAAEPLPVAEPEPEPHKRQPKPTNRPEPVAE